MSEIIGAGHPSYAALMAAWVEQGGRLVEHQSTWYRAIKAAEDVRFVPLEKKPERSSFGTPDKYHQAPYPPEFNDVGNSAR